MERGQGALQVEGMGGRSTRRAETYLVCWTYSTEASVAGAEQVERRLERSQGRKITGFSSTQGLDAFGPFRAFVQGNGMI